MKPFEEKLLNVLNLLHAELHFVHTAITTSLEWHKSHHGLATKSDLEQMEKRIVMNQIELTAALDKLTAQTGKIAKEQSDRFDALTKTIQDLKDVIAAGGDVTPEVTAALANTQAALDSLDAAIPDAPTP